eukprot:4603641-Pyramimonas_sp.AAC.1
MSLFLLVVFVSCADAIVRSSPGGAAAGAVARRERCEWGAQRSVVGAGRRPAAAAPLHALHHRGALAAPAPPRGGPRRRALHH